jgi:hypothetical protein
MGSKGYQENMIYQDNISNSDSRKTSSESPKYAERESNEAKVGEENQVFTQYQQLHSQQPSASSMMMTSG